VDVLASGNHVENGEVRGRSVDLDGRGDGDAEVVSGQGRGSPIGMNYS
jgi:hypothetical protein